MKINLIILLILTLIYAGFIIRLFIKHGIPAKLCEGVFIKKPLPP